MKVKDLLSETSLNKKVTLQYINDLAADNKNSFVLARAAGADYLGAVGQPLKKAFEKLDKDFKAIGGKPKDLVIKQDVMIDQLFTLAKKHLSPEDYKAYRQAFFYES